MGHICIHVGFVFLAGGARILNVVLHVGSDWLDTIFSAQVIVHEREVAKDTSCWITDHSRSHKKDAVTFQKQIQ